MKGQWAWLFAGIMALAALHEAHSLRALHHNPALPDKPISEVVAWRLVLPSTASWTTARRAERRQEACLRLRGGLGGPGMAGVPNRGFNDFLGYGTWRVRMPRTCWHPAAAAAAEA